MIRRKFDTLVCLAAPLISKRLNAIKVFDGIRETALRGFDEQSKELK